MSRETPPAERVGAHNRRASHDYHILETVEAGLVLTGTEVKSLRQGKASIGEAYATVEGDEAFVRQLHIPPYDQGNRWNVDPLRVRKLLLHRAEIVRPSIYSEMVWESRKRKAQSARTPIDWVVLRNRTSASRIEAKNKQRVGEALRTLSSRIGFRLAPGLSERVIYRELFPRGLTALDDLDERTTGSRPGPSHLTARHELMRLMQTLRLPLDERAQQRAAARAEWIAARAKPLELDDVLAE